MLPCFSPPQQCFRVPLSVPPEPTHKTRPPAPLAPGARHHFLSTPASLCRPDVRRDAGPPGFWHRPSGGIRAPRFSGVSGGSGTRAGETGSFNSHAARKSGCCPQRASSLPKGTALYFRRKRLPAAARRLPFCLFLLAAKTEKKNGKGESQEGDRPEQQMDRWILALINHRVKTQLLATRSSPSG